MVNSIKSAVIFIGSFAISISLLWCVLGPYLSARGIISLDHELDGYMLGLIGTVFGCMLCIRASKRTKLIQCIWFSLSSCVLFSICITWGSLSDREFSYWKLNWISQPEWNAMASNLVTLGTAALKKDQNQIMSPENDIPQKLQKLGLRSDYPFGYAQMGVPETGYTNVMVYLLFSNRSRTWGLFVGPEEYVKNRWPKFTCRSVAENAYFVIGGNN